jgi:ABC-type transporter Mla maintaining outer membrane lipid asymmetry ATPase subunit MlaF
LETSRLNSVEIRELSVRRGSRLVLPGISLSVRAGSVTGLLGPKTSGRRQTSPRGESSLVGGAARAEPEAGDVPVPVL